MQVQVKYDGKNLIVPAEQFFKKQVKRAPLEFYCHIWKLIKAGNGKYADATYRQIMEEVDRDRPLIQYWVAWLKKNNLLKVKKLDKGYHRFFLNQEKC